MISVKQVVGGFIVLVLLAVYGVFGRLDADDAERQQAEYCSMVAHHYWPDYKHVYKKECTLPGALPAQSREAVAQGESP
jgi:hypothetical protein